jgi:hypothetical protein
MRVQPVHVSFSAAAAVALLCLSMSALSSATSSTQEAIDVAVSPEQSTGARVEAANAVTEGWRDSLPLLLQDIDAYYQGDKTKPYAEDVAAKLVPLTDLLVRILINQDGSVQKFREVDNERTIDLLAAAAGGTERDLRFNASYILAKTVDDGNLCVILHRLRDQDLGYAGQVNLLQIAISGTSNAGRQNVQAAAQTVELLKKTTEGKVAVLVNLLDQIARSRENAAEPLPPESYCARYNIETGVATAPSETPPTAPSP